MYAFNISVYIIFCDWEAYSVYNGGHSWLPRAITKP